MLKRLLAVLMALALLVTGINYTPKTVNADTDYSALEFTTLGEGEYAFGYYSSTTDEIDGVVAPIVYGNTYLKFAYSANNITSDTVVNINGVTVSVGEAGYFELGQGMVTFNTASFADNAYTDIKITTTTGNLNVVIKKGSPSVEVTTPDETTTADPKEEVYAQIADSSINLALNKTATANPTVGEGENIYITDGVAIGDNHTATSFIRTATYFEIDLGALYFTEGIDKIVSVYKDTNMNYTPAGASGYEIQLSKNGIDFVTVKTVTAEEVSAAFASETSTVITDDVSTAASLIDCVQYVRIYYPTTAEFGCQVKEIAVLDTDKDAQIKEKPQVAVPAGITATSPRINTISYTIAEDEEQTAAGYTYLVYLNGVLKKSGLTAGTYEFENLAIGDYTVSIRSMYDGFISDMISSEIVTVSSEFTYDSTFITDKSKFIVDTKVIGDITYNNYVRYTGLTAFASSEALAASAAIDGSIVTRWGSQEGNDPQSITVDLGNIYSVKAIEALWETASSKDYIIEVSTNGTDFSEVAFVNDAASGDNRDDLIVLANEVDASFIRITGKTRTTGWGHSIWELGIYGSDAQKGKQDKPIEVVDAVIQSVEGYKVNVAWGQTNEQIALGQTYKVYIDGELYDTYSGATGISYTFTQAGNHTIKITANHNGYETEGVILDVTVPSGSGEGDLIVTNHWEAKRNCTVDWTSLIGETTEETYAVYADNKLVTTTTNTKITLYAYNFASNMNANNQATTVGNHNIKVMAVTEGTAQETITDETSVLGSKDFSLSVNYIYGNRTDIWNPNADCPWNFTICEGLDGSISEGADVAVTYNGDKSASVTINDAGHHTGSDQAWTIKAAIYDQATSNGENQNLSFSVVGPACLIGEQIQIKCVPEECDENDEYIEFVDGQYEEKLYTFVEATVNGEKVAVINYSLTFTAVNDTYDLLFGLGLLDPETLNNGEPITLEMSDQSVTETTMYSVTGVSATSPVNNGINAIWSTNVPEAQSADYTYSVYIDGNLITDAGVNGTTYTQLANGDIIPTGTHILTVSSVYKDGTVTGSVSTSVDVTALEEKLPDLIVSGITFSPSTVLYGGDQVTVTVTVKNIGDEAVTYDSTEANKLVTYLKIFIGGELKQQNYVIAPVPDGQTLTLSPDETIDSKFTYTIPLEGGIITFQGVADADGKFTESNEDNNDDYKVDNIFYSAPAEASLVNDGTDVSISWDADDNADHYEVKYTILNKVITKDENGSDVITYEPEEKIVTVNKSGNSMERYIFEGEYPSDNTKVTIISVTVMNEKNITNKATAKCDFIIAEMYVNEGVAILNQPFTVHSVLRNIGTATADGGKAKSITIAAVTDGEGTVIAENYNVYYVDDLNPNAGIDLDISLNSTKTGAFTLTGVADDINRYDELNEENNTKTCQVIVMNEKTLTLANTDDVVSATWDEPDALDTITKLQLTYISKGETKTVDLPADVTAYTFDEAIDYRTAVKIYAVYENYGAAKFAEDLAEPDLIITNLIASSEDIRVNENFNVTATVKNIGTSSVTGAPEGSDLTSDETYGYSISLVLLEQANFATKFDASYREGLEAGKSIDITVSDINTAVEGKYTLTFKTDEVTYVEDGTGFVKESDETNNTSTIDITVDATSQWIQLTDTGLENDKLYVKYGNFGTTIYERIMGDVYWYSPVNGVTSVEGYNGNYISINGSNEIFNGVNTTYKIIYPDGTTHDMIVHEYLDGSVHFASDDNLFALKNLHKYEDPDDGKIYYGVYKIQAINGEGENQTVTEIQLKMDLTPPVVPTPVVTATKEGNTSIAATWNTDSRYSYTVMLTSDNGTTIKKEFEPLETGDYTYTFDDLDEGTYNVRVTAHYIDLDSEEGISNDVEIVCPNEWILAGDSFEGISTDSFLLAKIFGNTEDINGEYKAKYYYLLNNLTDFTKNFGKLDIVNGYNGSYMAIRGSTKYFANGVTAGMDINQNIIVNPEDDRYLEYADTDFEKSQIYLTTYDDDREIQINTTDVFNLENDLSYFILRVYNQNGNYVNVPIKVETELPLIEVVGLTAGVRSEDDIVISWAQTDTQSRLDYMYNVYVTGPDGIEEKITTNSVECVTQILEDKPDGEYTIRVTGIYTGLVLNEETDNYEEATRETPGVTTTVTIASEEETIVGGEQTYPDTGWVNISGQNILPVTYDLEDGQSKLVPGTIQVLDEDIDNPVLTQFIYSFIGYNDYYIAINGSNNYFTGDATSIYAQREDETVFANKPIYDKYYLGQVQIVANQLFNVTEATSTSDGYTYYTVRVGSAENYTDVKVRIKAELDKEWVEPEKPIDDHSDPSTGKDWILINGEYTFDDFVLNGKNVTGTVYVYDEDTENDSLYTSTAYSTIGYNGHYMAMMGAANYFVGADTGMKVATVNDSFTEISSFEDVTLYDKYYPGQIQVQTTQVFKLTDLKYDDSIGKLYQIYNVRIYDGTKTEMYTDVYYKVVLEDLEVLEVDPGTQNTTVDNPQYLLGMDINNSTPTMDNTYSYLYEQLKWTETENTAKYKIWYSTDDSTQAFAYGETSSTDIYIDPTIIQAGDYYFWIQSVDEEGNQAEGTELRRTPITVHVSADTSNAYVGAANGVWDYTVVHDTLYDNAKAVVKNDNAESNKDTQEILGATQYNFTVDVMDSGTSIDDVLVNKNITTDKGTTYLVEFTEFLICSTPGVKTVQYNAYDINGNLYTVTDTIEVTSDDLQEDGTYKVSKDISKKITASSDEVVLEFKIAKDNSDTVGTEYTYGITYLQLSETTVDVIDDKEDEFLNVVGFQMNTNTTKGQVSDHSPSFRTVSAVSDYLTINGEKHEVQAYGTVYASDAVIPGGDYSSAVVGGLDANKNSLPYQQATDEYGKLRDWTTGDPKTDAYNHYALTLKDNGINAASMTTKYVFRAYAVLDDGTYVYGTKVYTVSIYQIAQNLYENNKMISLRAHEYLYNNVLNIVSMSNNRVALIKKMMKSLGVTNTSNPYFATCNVVYDEIFKYMTSYEQYPRSTIPVFSVEDKLAEGLGKSTTDWIYEQCKADGIDYYYPVKPYDWDNTLSGYDSE